MSETGKISNSVAKILTYILVVLLVLGVAGAIIYVVGLVFGVDVTDPLFYEYNGSYYYYGLDDDYSIDLEYGDNEFIVSKDEFTVTITSNPDMDFDFVCNDVNCEFYSDSDNDDYTDIFDISYTDSGFIITIPDWFNVMSCIKNKYGGDVIAEELSEGNYFILTVVSDGCSIEASLGGFRLYGIDLNYSAIVF